MADDRVPDQEEYSRTGVERTDGYREALTKHGVAWDSQAVVKLSVPCSLRGGATAAEKFLSLPQSVTGVVCMSDIIAIGMIQELKRAGKRLPHDVSVVGFDDIPESSFVSPALTTVWQPADRKGVRAAELLVDMMHGRAIETRVEFRCRLVERESVARPRGAKP
jgi:DNA-binding LacI/PurR family transcriptional regulator